jgi:hypothetical protein
LEENEVNNIIAGDRLYFVPGRYRTGRTPEWITVEKVGRRWITFTMGARMAVGSVEIDGGGYASPGRVYRTEAEYEAERQRAEAWRDIRRFVDGQHAAPADIDLAAVAKALRMPGA